MLTVSLYIGVQAIRALIDGSHPEGSPFGVGLATISLLLLPWLGAMKLRVASKLASHALRGDGVLTLAAAVLAAVTLASILVNTTLEWWWADPLAAMVIACALATESARLAIRHRFG